MSTFVYWIRQGLLVIGALCFFYGFAHYVFVFMWAFLSQRAMKALRPALHQTVRTSFDNHPDAPGVTLVMPMFNESALIVDTVGAVLRSHYREIEVMVVNDGSTDNSLQLLIDAYDLVKLPGPLPPQPVHTEEVYSMYRSRADARLTVVDKKNGGSKADSANAAINFCTKPWVVIMDSDELVPPQAVGRVMSEIMTHPGNVVAVGVSLLPANNCVVEKATILDDSISWNYWLGCQAVEYFTAFLLSRPGMAEIGALPIVSGGFGVYRRDILQRLNGFSHPHLGEDLDLVVRLHKTLREAGEEYVVLQVPEAIIFTEFPQSMAVLKRQRMRWHRGLRQVIMPNLEIVGNPKYGNFGKFGMMMMFLFEWIAPFVEGFGYLLYLFMLAVGWINPLNALMLILASQALGCVITGASVWTAVKRLDWYKRKSDVGKLLFFSVASQWGFRQLTVYWRLRSLFGKQQVWGAMPRAGFKSAPAK